LLFDSGYGAIREFLHELDDRDEKFIAQIPESHFFWDAKVQVMEPNPNGMGRPASVNHLHVKDPKAKSLSAKQWKDKLMGRKAGWKSFRLTHLHEPRTTRAIAMRVRESVRSSGTCRRAGSQVRWLIIEQLEDGTFKYYLSNLPENTKLKKMMKLAHTRWPVEQGYQQLKEELGLDHFEGRSWLGLHHHVTLCFMAYDFLCILQHERIKKTRQTGARRDVGHAA
jgi:SRSO17 transposase